MPFFSVIIPVYNVEKYIHQCLDSVLEQTFKDFEVIILDDGSMDNSGNICDEYARNDTRIKVIHDKNQGSFMARIRALDYVKGEYVLYLDSDDYWENDLLETVYGVVLEKSVDMILLRYKAVDENGKLLYYQRQLLEDKQIVKVAQKFLGYQLATSFEYNSMVLKVVKREALNIKKDYGKVKDVAMGDDAIQSMMILENIDSFIYLNKPYYNYRVNISSLTTKVTKKYADDFLKVREKIEEEFIKYYKKNTEEYVHKIEYDIRGIVGLLADSANSQLIDNIEWNIIRKKIVESQLFQNVYEWKGKISIISKIYIIFIVYGFSYLWRVIGKMKLFLRFLYNRIL